MLTFLETGPILLSLLCTTVLRKYDLRKYVITFKARSPASVSKSIKIQHVEGAIVDFLIPIATDIANLYSFTQGSLEWPFNELLFSDVSLWNQYKYIAFNIFSSRIENVQECKMKLYELLFTDDSHIKLYGYV